MALTGCLTHTISNGSLMFDSFWLLLVLIFPAHGCLIVYNMLFPFEFVFVLVQDHKANMLILGCNDELSWKSTYY